MFYHHIVYFHISIMILSVIICSIFIFSSIICYINIAQQLDTIGTYPSFFAELLHRLCPLGWSLYGLNGLKNRGVKGPSFGVKQNCLIYWLI